MEHIKAQCKNREWDHEGRDKWHREGINDIGKGCRCLKHGLEVLEGKKQQIEKR